MKSNLHNGAIPTVGALRNPISRIRDFVVRNNCFAALNNDPGLLINFSAALNNDPASLNNCSVALNNCSNVLNNCPGLLNNHSIALSKGPGPLNKRSTAPNTDPCLLYARSVVLNKGPGFLHNSPGHRISCAGQLSVSSGAQLYATLTLQTRHPCITSAPF